MDRRKFISVSTGGLASMVAGCQDTFESDNPTGTTTPTSVPEPNPDELSFELLGPFGGPATLEVTAGSFDPEGLFFRTGNARQELIPAADIVDGIQEIGDTIDIGKLEPGLTVRLVEPVEPELAYYDQYHTVLAEAELPFVVEKTVRDDRRIEFKLIDGRVPASELFISWPELTDDKRIDKFIAKTPAGSSEKDVVESGAVFVSEDAIPNDVDADKFAWVVAVYWSEEQNAGEEIVDIDTYDQALVREGGEVQEPLSDVPNVDFEYTLKDDGTVKVAPVAGDSFLDRTVSISYVPKDGEGRVREVWGESGETIHAGTEFVTSQAVDSSHDVVLIWRAPEQDGFGEIIGSYSPPSN